MENIKKLSEKSKRIYLQYLKIDIGLKEKNCNINIISAGKFKKKQYEKIK